ncbi:iron ABC transporter [Echinicola pacifica]|uniref:Iron ABC transporter n=1 Tax=Echinicola pacifica TaxID=346377 RepID=A0A918QDM4_9BACT|nr:helical backbone metal receptor [Echinicola pacifica]GGZ40845.1 iron ABC transporter [Echinicola pacifica]
MNFQTTVDQMGRQVTCPELPQRIISLVPSHTEMLMDLGLGDRLVGITKFCIRPKGLRESKTLIGGTKNFNFDKITALKPDLIIGNKEENYREGILRLEEDFPVWMSDVFDLEDTLQMISSLGKVLGLSASSEQLAQKIRAEFAVPVAKKGTAAYLIWNAPMMAAGPLTFIDKMLAFAGFENVVVKSRYPELSENDLAGLDPEYILLSSEPFPFGEKHLATFKEKYPESKILLVDGEMFSWYGSRLQYAPSYFRSLDKEI